MGGRVSVSGGGETWGREHRPLITEGYGQSGLRLFILLKKTKGVNQKQPTEIQLNVLHFCLCWPSTVTTYSVCYTPACNIVIN